MLSYLKFLFNKFHSAKYIRKGKCNKCGACCRNIAFFYGKYPVRTENQFELLKQSNKHCRNFYISGKDSDGALLFTCRALKPDNTCGAYFFRGLMCRTYPAPSGNFLANGGKLQDGCGYYFIPDKNFSSFLE